MNTRPKKVRPEGSSEAQEHVEAAWAAELDDRIRDVKAGRVELIPADHALREVRAGLKRMRAR